METLAETTASPDSAPAPQPRKKPGVGSRLIALVGELMIIAGAVIGLYVVWQLFYTDIEANSIQEEAVKELDWAYTAPITAGEPTSTGPETIPNELKLSPDTAEVMDEPAFGTTFATFYVPRWGEDYVKPISEGVDRHKILDRLGIGHYPGTGMPGELGNFAISAHRTTYGKPFNRIAELKKNDYLIVQTETAWYVYKVTSHEIVRPTAVKVIAPVPNDPGAAPDDHYITLTSCHPMFSAAERYVVHGVLEYWSPVGNGVPEELLEVPGK
ncbi:class E sortase [Demequina sp.]|uniref:class E sortase n=1 Tax=Demequina sp. TaxID=2050685 RepID=UPI003D113C94